MDAVPTSREPPGLEVVLDRLDYARGGAGTPEDLPHVFVYHLTIRNGSTRAVRLLARKWVVVAADGRRTIVEGERIVGKTPHLEPGEAFSYNSFHLTAGDARAEGSFHGVDDDGAPVHVRIPPFAMRVPGA